MIGQNLGSHLPWRDRARPGEWEGKASTNHNQDGTTAKHAYAKNRRNGEPCVGPRRPPRHRATATVVEQVLRFIDEADGIIETYERWRKVNVHDPAARDICFALVVVDLKDI